LLLKVAGWLEIAAQVEGSWLILDPVFLIACYFPIMLTKQTPFTMTVLIKVMPQTCAVIAPLLVLSPVLIYLLLLPSHFARNATVSSNQVAGQ
jgi:hypothetical protein